jgi:hypothetical protein
MSRILQGSWNVDYAIRPNLRLLMVSHSQSQPNNQSILPRSILPDRIRLLTTNVSEECDCWSFLKSATLPFSRKFQKSLKCPTLDIWKLSQSNGSLVCLCRLAVFSKGPLPRQTMLLTHQRASYWLTEPSVRSRLFSEIKSVATTVLNFKANRDCPRCSINWRTYSYWCPLPTTQRSLDFPAIGARD